jgi:hypothetical protein
MQIILSNRLDYSPVPGNSLPVASLDVTHRGGSTGMCMVPSLERLSSLEATRLEEEECRLYQYLNHLVRAILTSPLFLTSTTNLVDNG